MLEDKLKVNYIKSRPEWLPNISNIIGKTKDTILNSTNYKSKVSIFFDLPWDIHGYHISEISKDSINFFFSVIESTKLPTKWVNCINETFDAVIVPNEWVMQVNIDSGIKLPIFILDHPIDISDLVLKDSKLSLYKKNKEDFIFGICAAGYPKKNIEKVIEAFLLEFDNEKNIKLYVHLRYSSQEILNNLENLIKKSKNNNILLSQGLIKREDYIENFLSKIDCYILVSKGEGFSMTPREALALGIPCILSNNTAHRIICNTGFVESVDSNIKVPAFYDVFNEFCGEQFDCFAEDIRKAMRNVYNNYELYLNKSNKARDWVKQYMYQNLADNYFALVYPKNIILDNFNKIEDGYIITNSKELYDKYNLIKN